MKNNIDLLLQRIDKNFARAEHKAQLINTLRIMQAEVRETKEIINSEGRQNFCDRIGITRGALAAYRAKQETTVEAIKREIMQLPGEAGRWSL